MLSTLINITLVITFVYCAIFLVIALKNHFSKSFSPASPSNEFASILIPARNEAPNIKSCLAQIVAQNYAPSSCEVIVVNDHSDDETGEIVREFIRDNPSISIQLINANVNENGKKAALKHAVSLAKGELIITRDADTFNESESWLRIIAGFFSEYKSDMIICPVRLKTDRSFIAAFESAEHVFLQSLTMFSAKAGTPFLCNGANLAFRKSAFVKVNGYQGNMDKSSGDDIFLLQKFKQHNLRIDYLNSEEASVTTFASGSWKDLIHRKLRWAGKAGRTFSFFGLFSGLILSSVNLLLPLSLCLSLIFGGSYKSLIACVLFKWIIDFLLLTLWSWLKKSWNWIPWFVVLELFNHVYFILIPIALLFVKPVWKGRTTE